MKPASKHLSTTLLLSVCLLLLLPVSAAWSAPDAPLAWQTNGVAQRALLDSPAAISGYTITPLDAQRLSDSEVLILPLPDGDRIALRSQLNQRDQRHLHWVGHLEGLPEYSVSLTHHQGHLLGLVHTPDAVWELALASGGLAILQSLDHSLYPPCAGAVDPELGERTPPTRSFNGQQPAALPLARRNSQVDPDEQIDLLVLYSPQVLAFYGNNHGAAQAHGQAAVDNANVAFANSEMTPRFRVVGNQLWDRDESTFPGTASSGYLSQLRASTWVNQLRDELRADMVGLLVQDGRGGCGVGYVMRNPSPAFASSAFQVTARSCAVGNLTYAHEHGHNMGFEHDPANGTSPGSASFPWSFGHYVSGSFRTVMSYASECDGSCPRRMYFSNPNVRFNGEATGIHDQRDNARSGNLVAGLVANFRLSVKDLLFADGFEGNDEE